MKLNDREGRLFVKISVVDVLAILLVAAMAAAIGYVKNSQTADLGNGTVEQAIRFQVRVSGVPAYMEDAVQVGDQLYDVSYPSGGALGEITQVQTEPGFRDAMFQDGTWESVPVEDGIDLVLTVEGFGLVGESGSYMLNRVYDLGVNSARTYYTKYARFDGRVIGIL